MALKNKQHCYIPKTDFREQILPGALNMLLTNFRDSTVSISIFSRESCLLAREIEWNDVINVISLHGCNYSIFRPCNSKASEYLKWTIGRDSYIA